MDREIPESIQSQLRIEELDPKPHFDGYIDREQAQDLDPADIETLIRINQIARYFDYLEGIVRLQNKQLRYLEFELFRRRTNTLKAILGLLTAITIAVLSAWLHSIFK